MYKTRKKKYARKTVHRVRGGSFTTKLPKLPRYVSDPLKKELYKHSRKHLSPKALSRYLNKIIHEAVGKNNAAAAELLKELAKPLSVKVGDAILKLVPPPGEGVGSGKEGRPIPFTTESSVVKFVGANQLYHGREHKVKFVAGNSHGKWMREMAKANGSTKEKMSDTTEISLDSNARKELTELCGPGRKLEVYFKETLFGVSANQILPYLGGLTSLQSSISSNQTAYIGISNLFSKLTLTSLNKYVPIYVKFRLLKPMLTTISPGEAWNNCFNADLTVQTDGCIPRLSQMTVLDNSDYMRVLAVDYKSAGITGCDNFKANFKVIATKTVKLYAGDRAKVRYDHLFGSGMNLSKIFSMSENTSLFNGNTPLTYILSAQIWGEEVDITSVGTNAGNVIKASAPFKFQVEGERSLKGVQAATNMADSIDSGTTKGFNDMKFAVKIFSNEVVSASGRRWSDSYGNYGINYEVPIMSESVLQEGGSVNV